MGVILMARNYSFELCLTFSVWGSSKVILTALSSSIFKFCIRPHYSLSLLIMVDLTDQYILSIGKRSVY